MDGRMRMPVCALEPPYLRPSGFTARVFTLQSLHHTSSGSMLLSAVAAMALAFGGTQALGIRVGTRMGARALAAPRDAAAPIKMSFFDQVADNMKQMSDQRVAKISHVMLRTDEAALAVRTKGECYELLSAWKDVIQDDAERFATCARERSECASKRDGGDLGWKTRGSLSKAFNDIAFVEEPGRVYGPIETEQGLHLLFLHFCGEPEGDATAPRWMSNLIGGGPGGSNK